MLVSAPSWLETTYQWVTTASGQCFRSGQRAHLYPSLRTTTTNADSWVQARLVNENLPGKPVCLTTPLPWPPQVILWSDLRATTWEIMSILSLLGDKCCWAGKGLILQSSPAQPLRGGSDDPNFIKVNPFLPKPLAL